MNEVAGGIVALLDFRPGLGAGALAYIKKIESGHRWMPTFGSLPLSSSFLA